MQHDRLERDPSTGRRLQGLPEEPQPYGFAEFQRRARQRPASTRGLPRVLMLEGRAWLPLAAAAAIALIVTGLFLSGDREGSGRALTVSTGGQPPAERPETASRDLDVIPAVQTEAMEGWLASLPAEPAVVHVRARATVASLEDRIAMLDDVISAERAARAPHARLALIEQQRSQLLTSLVQVRYAEDLATASY